MDRISELPPEILHQILSLLHTKTAARTAVLSKLWLKTCYTNPRLNFDEEDLHSTDDESEFESDFDTTDESDVEADAEAEAEADLEAQNSRKLVEYRHGEFLRIVDNILERYRCENLLISDFKLKICFSDQTDCDGLLDKWLAIIAEKRVSQVAILVESRTEDCSKRYSLLADTIFSMESLQQLEFNQCKLLKRKTLLSEDKIKCSNLKNLTLLFVTVSESAINSLISCCPQLLTISLQYCIGLSRIRAPKSLPNLLSLSILSCTIEEVHIVDAPKLLFFEYENEWEAYSPEIRLRVLNIGTCQNLTRVQFVEAEIDDTFLFELMPKLHFIKELILHFCEYLNEINISSSTLEICSISNCDCSTQAHFDAPKLRSLAFSNQHRLPSVSFISASSQCRISIKYDTIRYFSMEAISEDVLGKLKW